MADQPTPFNNTANILIVDDTPANLQVLAGMLKAQGLKARPVPNGKLALQAAKSNPPDLILLDVMMPGMDGYEVCRLLKEDDTLRDIPVIFLSALTETVDKVKAFQAGGVDYVTKPFQLAEVRARVEIQLKLRSLQMELKDRNHHLEELVQAQVKEISDSQMTTIFALAKLAESRDEDTGKHLERVQIFCRLLAAKMREERKHRFQITVEYIENIFRASPLHDIGKVGIPDSILLKPDRLTPEEFEKMKMHTVLGWQTLDAVRGKYPGNAFVNMGLAIARSHHEQWGGGGYPDGLVGEAIPLAARIMAVADVYDALRSERCYKPPFSHEQSCGMILEMRETQFDPKVVDAFLSMEGEFREIRELMAD